MIEDSIGRAGSDTRASGNVLLEAANNRVVLRRDAFFRRVLALADVTAAAFALVLSTWLMGSTELEPEALAVLPVVVIAAKMMGLYDRDEHQVRKTTIDDTPKVLQAAVVFTLCVWIGEEIFVTGPLDRSQVFGLIGLTFALMLAGRGLGRSFAMAVTPTERCVVLGNAGSAARVSRKLDGAAAVHAVVLGRVSLDDGTYAAGFPGCPPNLGHVDELPMLLVTYEVERVVIAPDGHDQGQILDAVRLIKAMGVKVSVLPRLLEVVGSSSTFDDVDGLTLLGVRRYGLSQSSAFLKRMMDVLAAAAGLMALAPLFAVIAIAIKLDSRGPVFFRQRRIGRGGEEFRMIKFRSMVTDAEERQHELQVLNEAFGLFKIANDPRITRFGKLIRRTSLDELPQLVNVLKGDMSLVGPRPLVAREDALIQGWERRRSSLRPGMTGLWQIFGSARIPMEEMVKIDYLYGANWSLWLDVKVLLRTLPYVLRRRGL